MLLIDNVQLVEEKICETATTLQLPLSLSCDMKYACLETWSIAMS